ncbi:MAG: aminomethyl-transferring glycine dehydrogenase, partial [Thermoplasmata archaeon]|nr:aminomethyl-transferring glycine dehydrogenase [Thermoplasmata archaeon]
DVSDLKSKADDQTSAVYVESPNFFGVFEDIAEIKDAIGDALLTVGANPLSLAIVKPPGDLGADIVVGEGQILGNPMNYGGPLVGIFACKEEHIRKMPGRVIGATTDSNGRRAFTMALQTREQHIRREKATSNICTNESLGSVAFAIHVAILGRDGLWNVAKDNVEKALDLAHRIGSVDGFDTPVFFGTQFNEFVVRSEASPSDVNSHLLKNGIQGGLPLSSNFPELENCALYCTTEMHTKEDHDSLINALEGFS